MGVQLKGAFLLVARLAQANLRNARLKGELTSAAQRACPRNSSATPTTMTLTDPAEGRASAVWLIGS